MVIVDTEVYSNYFLALFKDIGSGKYRALEMFEGAPLDAISLDVISLKKIEHYA